VVSKPPEIVTQILLSGRGGNYALLLLRHQLAMQLPLQRKRRRRRGESKVGLVESLCRIFSPPL